jgi:GTPase SAR1 family protein
MDPESLTAAETHFLPEIQKLGEPGAQFVLVGTKIDLRDDAAAITDLKERTGLEPVTSQLGEMKARDLGFFRYHEISALRWEGIDELLQLIAAAHASGLPRPRDDHKGAKCALM